MRKRWLMVALSMIVCSMFLLNGCTVEPAVSFPEERLFESGDFTCFLDVPGKNLTIYDLSEQGKQKETIIIPKEINGFPVKEYTYPVFFGCKGSFESEILRQIYIIPSVHTYEIYSNLSPNLEKIVLIGTNSVIGGQVILTNAGKGQMYISTADHLDWQVNETGNLGRNCWPSNCNYFYNYDGAEHDGYYWSDNYDYGEKITYVPQNPEREGYIFGGWFQEPECVNIWNFDTDTLPEAKYNEEGEALYQETRLYAKWYIEE